MLKKAARIFGYAFIAVGILGFVPGITNDGYLFGIFEVGVVHNIVHLLSGAVALWAGYSSEHASHLYFQIFGVIYALVAVIGIFYGDRPLLGIMAHNNADVVLHFIIAGAALYLGFAVKETEGHRTVHA
jgi:hypothetical protein